MHPTFVPWRVSLRSLGVQLLVATRHILATDFRSGFFAQKDILLDEKVLVGEGRTGEKARY